MKTSKELKKFKISLRKRATKSEKLFENILIENNIDYKTQMIFGFYILDFCLPEYLLNIEIDGGYHNEQKWKDKLRDNFVTEAGFNVIRINNDEVKDFDINKILNSKKNTVKDFRSCLGKANSLKSKYIIQNRKNLITENNLKLV